MEGLKSEWVSALFVYAPAGGGRSLTVPPSKARTGSAAVLGRSNPGSLEREEITRMLLQGRSCCARGRAQPSVVVSSCAHWRMGCPSALEMSRAGVHD